MRRLAVLPKGVTRADLLLVIVPYFDEWFAKEVLRRFKPRKVRFLVDDGTRSEDIDRLQKTFQGSDFKIALGVAPGLMHLKIFYVESAKGRNKAGSQRVMVFGSANATDAAFGRAINAELTAEVRLSARDDQSILKYVAEVLSAIEDGDGKVAETTVKATRSLPKLVLPAIRVREVRRSPGFDAWLQKGMIVAKYRDDQQFMRVQVRLRKELPAGQIEDVFKDAGLRRVGNSDVVRWAYIPVPSERDERTEKWKSKYCVWTHLGDWLSEDCYQRHSAKFESEAAPAKKLRIEELLSHGENVNWRAEKRRSFIALLQRVWERLHKTGVKPADYLIASRGKLDTAYYEGLLDKKIVADHRRAQDKEFQDRFIKGYEFSKMPKFRQDTPAWNAFVRTWVETVVLEASRKGTRSFVAKSVRDYLFEFSELLDVDQLQEALRIQWIAEEVGQCVWAEVEGCGWYTATIVRKVGPKATIEFDDDGERKLVSLTELGLGYVLNFYDENY